MQRLDYHLQVQSDGAVQAELLDGEKTIPSGTGYLNLSQLTVLTKDYLPWLETTNKQTYNRLERLGTLLYELLFIPPVRGHFEELAWRKIAEHPDNYRLALSLTFQEAVRADVAALPWEFLYFPRGHTFLATNACISFSRRFSDWVSLSSKRLYDEPLRILLVRLQPPGMAPVALTPISNALKDLATRYTTLLNPYVLENPEPLQVEEALQHYQPHIVHLLAHGRFNDRGTRFAFLDGSQQEVRWYGDRSLADLFAANRPQLILLQACEGGRSSDLLSFANGGSWLVRHHIPAVIAMHYPITNKVGWAFAQTFYEQIAMGEDLDVSVQRARRTLAKIDTETQTQDDYASRDFAAPILWMRPAMRRLFTNQLTEEEHDSDQLIQLIIKTPQGDDYLAEVSTSTLVDHLVNSFLRQWQPPQPELHQSKRYSLRYKDDAQKILERSYTLRDADLSGQVELLLVSESLTPHAPISLLVENDRGEQFKTIVLLSTSAGQLAQEFLKSTPGIGEVIIEQVDNQPDKENRHLRLDNTLYEQGVSDDALLRIYRTSTQ